MNTFGILLGIATVLVIGLGFLWVVYAERYLGYLWWSYFLGLGLLLIGGSLFIPSDWGAALTGILGASFVWGATELKEQSIRAKLGWFSAHEPKINPPLAGIIKKIPPPHL